jgi:O-antigen ligase/tetratricopeptide (TPR) repeat protein
VFAIGEGVVVLREWTETGTVPGARHLADTAPLGAWFVLAVLAMFALVRRANLERCALAALAWSFGVSVITHLPAVALSQKLCDGPALRAPYLLLAFAAGAWSLATRTADARQRAVAAAVFWSSANSCLWGRDTEHVWVLLWAAVLFALGSSGAWRDVRESFRAMGTIATWSCALLLAWLALAAAFADSPTLGASTWLRVAWGALLALVIAAGRRDAARAAWSGLLAGAVASVIVMTVGIADAAHESSLERVLGSRLRLFGLHSNYVAPLFALCLCLAAAEIARALHDRRLRAPNTSQALRAVRVPRALRALRGTVLAFLITGALFGLVRSETRAAALGAVIGLAGFVWCMWLPAPRRLWAVGVAALSLAGAGLVFLSTPLASHLHERLRALTFTQSALGQRYYLWSLAASVLRDRPFFGAGPNVYYVHARYAVPSFYDHTSQTLHSHSLFVGIAEGCGWVGLVLFCCACIAALDALRRAARAPALIFGDRAIAAGTFAALAAVLASNVVDVGQSRNTLVPILVWIALGAGVALLATEEANSATTPRSASIRACLALALFCALVLAPAIALHCAKSARSALQSGEPERAIERGENALALWPIDTEVHLTLFAARRVQSDADGALREARALVAARPGFAAYHLYEARAELDLGDPERARGSAERALACDPLGQESGEAWFMLAGAHLRLSDRASAEAALLNGLRTEGDGWRGLPRVRAPPNDPSDKRERIAFALGSPDWPTGSIELDGLLETLERELRDASDARRLERRRELGRVVGLWRSAGAPERALALLDEVERDAQFQNLSFDLVRIGLCVELGRLDEAEALRASSPSKDDSRMVAGWARTLLAAGGEERIARVMADAPLLERFEGRDLAFDAGTTTSALALAAELALRRGDFAHALELLRYARYDCLGSQARLALSHAFLALCAEVRPPREGVLAALGETLLDASLDRRSARDATAMKTRVELVRTACGNELPAEAEIARACRAQGEAGAAFERAEREAARAPARKN